MLKQINPEDLVEGKECFMKFIVSNEKPLNLSDMSENTFRLSGSEPIYTLEQTADTDLEMLVNVASRLYVAHGNAVDGINKFMPNREIIAREAIQIITACKQALKEGER